MWASHSSRQSKAGFTLVELIIVVAVIAILVVVSAVAYNGVQRGARDTALLSDIGNFESEVARYATKNGGQYGSAVEWYSENDPNPNLPVMPSEGNVIDIVADDTRYCIRGYNIGSNYPRLSQAAYKQSGDGACDALEPSEEATTDSPEVVPPTYMDIEVASKLVAGNNADLSGYTTASVTLNEGDFYLLGINALGTATTQPTVTMAGVTWTELTTDTVNSGNRLTVYYALPSSTVTGTITLTFSGTQTGTRWSLVELKNTNDAGTNGADAIVQHATNKAVTTVTLSSALSQEKNIALGFFVRQSGAAHSAANGETLINGGGQSTPNMALAALYKVNSQSITVDIATNTVGIVIEVAAGIEP